MTSPTTSVYRIFLSSTAIDLVEHRQKVSDAILRLGDLPVGMETFGAMPNEPVEVCQEKARSCDALVVMVAHRYGRVPEPDDGGDGHKSITWLEVEAGMAAGKPVFAFLVDADCAWSQPKEQDLLEQAQGEDEAMEVFEKVQALKEFRRFLEGEAGLTRATFTTPDNLAAKVTASLANWVRAPGPSPVATPRTWTFRVVHPLQPAPHFRGRASLLADLRQWWEDLVHPDRVRSLVAIGGAGKTAVAERFLAGIRQERLRGSVLVWSFYEAPNTDAFLAEACVVFAGEEGEGVGGRLERVQRALAGGEPHLLVLDGLERVQSEGQGGRARGELEDHQVKNLLRAIAGGLGRTRALVTSRFKLADLEPWEGSGFRTHRLDVLDEPAAASVLGAWGVAGEDEQLLALAEQVGRHALSVSVLGSYLHHFREGDPGAAEELDLDDVGADDPQAAKLGRILAGYGRDLPDAERDLLVRLSVFPRGVSVEVIGYLIDAGGEIPGTLVGMDQARLAHLSERLRDRGLVFAYERQQAVTYTAHPFLRDYFRSLLGVPPEQIHEAVRSRLAGGLDARPDTKPKEPELLDRYEALIEHTILAGQVQEAYDLYRYGLGGGRGQDHIYHVLGDYGRIVRIVSRFAEDDEPEHLAPQLASRRRSNLVSVWGLAARELGDLALAERSLDLSNELDRQAGDWRNLSQGLQNSASVAMDRAAFPLAKQLLAESLDHAKADDEYVRKGSHGRLACVCHALGEISEAQSQFTKAREAHDGPLDSLVGIYEAEHLLALGDVEATRVRTLANLATCQQSEWIRDVAFCHALLGLLSLPDSLADARTHLKALRDWSAQSGHMECILRAHILAAEIARHSGDLPAALAEARTGLNHAEGCGFGRFAIDLLVLLAKTQLEIPDPRAALGRARDALDRSQHPDCQYAWGEADALHLCAVCHQALGEPELAKQRFDAAIKVRERIQHPGLEETRELARALEKGR